MAGIIGVPGLRGAIPCAPSGYLPGCAGGDEERRGVSSRDAGGTLEGCAERGATGAGRAQAVEGAAVAFDGVDPVRKACEFGVRGGGARPCGLGLFAAGESPELERDARTRLCRRSVFGGQAERGVGRRSRPGPGLGDGLFRSRREPGRRGLWHGCRFFGARCLLDGRGFGRGTGFGGSREIGGRGAHRRWRRRGHRCARWPERCGASGRSARARRAAVRRAAVRRARPALPRARRWDRRWAAGSVPGAAAAAAAGVAAASPPTRVL